MADACRKPLFEAVEVIVPLREHQWRPPVTHGLDDVLADALRAPPRLFPRGLSGRTGVQGASRDWHSHIRVRRAPGPCLLRGHDLEELSQVSEVARVPRVDR